MNGLYGAVPIMLQFNLISAIYLNTQLVLDVNESLLRVLRT